MDKKLQYATMLEIPVNTCSITFKEEKKRWFRRKKKPHEQIKQELVDKVNAEITESNITNTETENQVVALESEVATTELENQLTLEDEEQREEVETLEAGKRWARLAQAPILATFAIPTTGSMSIAADIPIREIYF